MFPKKEKTTALNIARISYLLAIVRDGRPQSEEELVQLKKTHYAHLTGAARKNVRMALNILQVQIQVRLIYFPFINSQLSE